jgi:hypothetical protein
LKRVNGLEKRLKDEAKETGHGIHQVMIAESIKTAVEKKPTRALLTQPDAPDPPTQTQPPQLQRPQPPQRHPSIGFPVQNNTLLDAYFTRIHSKPYYILDEAATRQRWQTGQLPPSVINAVHAVTARCVSYLICHAEFVKRAPSLTESRFAPQHVGGHNAAVRHAEECAARARNLMDIDDPTIENVQVLLLLSTAFFQAGKGKKSYMLLSTCQGMINEQCKIC